VVLGESIAGMSKGKGKGGGGNAHDRAMARAAGADTDGPISNARKKAAQEKIENIRRRRARNELLVTAIAIPVVLLLIPRTPLIVLGISLVTGLILAHALWGYFENSRLSLRLMLSLAGLLALVSIGFFSEFFDVDQNLSPSVTFEDGAPLTKASYTVHNGSSFPLAYGEVGCITVSLVESKGILLWTGHGEPIYPWTIMGQAGPVGSGNDVKSGDCIGRIDFPNQEMSCLDMIVNFQYRIQWLGFFPRTKRFRFLGTFHNGKTTFVQESVESGKSGDWVNTYCESYIKLRDRPPIIMDSSHARH
jgi:hypothetical protein